MGDFFQVIVDKDASVDDAEQLSSDILNWLVDEGIVEKTLTDCVLGKARLGHPPGPSYERVVEYDGFDIQSIITNGLDIVIGHTVFHPGQGAVVKVCPNCGVSTAFGDEWMTAVDQWYSGEGDYIVRCANCGYAKPITEWSADMPWGFGDLGFLFWNWAPFKQSFIDEFARRLGHRIVHVAGKL